MDITTQYATLQYQFKPVKTDTWTHKPNLDNRDSCYPKPYIQQNRSKYNRIIMVFSFETKGRLCQCSALFRRLISSSVPKQKMANLEYNNKPSWSRKFERVKEELNIDWTHQPWTFILLHTILRTWGRDVMKIKIQSVQCKASFWEN